MMRDWDIRNGPNLWRITSGTINLVQGQLDYTMPANLVTMTEMYYTTVNGNGAGYNSDRIMVPINRTQYAMIPNKAQPGIPTQFWFQYVNPPQVTIWQPAFSPAPNYVLNWYGLARIEDANLGSGETPDVLFRGLEALCAEMALRLAETWLDMSLWDRLYPALQKRASMAWDNFASIDQEQGPMIIQPNLAGYGQIR